MTNSKRGLPRRSFLSAATAVAAAGVLGGGVVVAGAPAASAATGADITWRITTEPGDESDGAKRTYAAMLNAIRQAVRSHQVRPEDGRPVDVTDAGGTTQYISVDLHAEGLPDFIRVFMRRSDAYVMGWRQGTEDGAGTINWGTFFTLDAAVAPTLNGTANPALLPGSTNANTDTRYDRLANYNDLQQQGATRDGMQITPSSLHNAVLQLQAAPQPETRYIAQSLLQIIVGLAEATRFRNQAAATVTAFGNGQPYTVTPEHREQHNNWGLMSEALLAAVIAGAAVLAAPIVIAGIEYETAVALAAVMMLAHHSGKNSGGKKLEGSTKLVAPDGTGDYWTVQAAINAAPTYGVNTIFIDKGVYHEVISVPKDKSWLTIQGVTGNRGDVVIYNTRCNGMINPATGTKYGTQGSAVATFRPPNLTVQDLTISNTFDSNAHPEISPYETQAVAIAAMGDRQTYDNVSIMSHQDTLLVKGDTPTTQARQHFVNCLIRGDVDFIFGNATAVIDRSTIQVLPWPGGTVVAPNTDKSKKYGILIISSTITTTGVPNDTMHLGRPWNNTADAWPQAVVRNCDIQAGIKDAQPWTNMLPEYPWQYARFKEYNNFGPGAGVGANAPKLTDAEAADYTAQKYLAGTDGWNPVG
ncbi:pectinesterase family protein [Streptomyces sp. NPDC005483]|uniref:pectinesterase family protein n=1 Tax=Streptomyces sp. NPDC005483 TaxID=3154882 RepID=UPI0033B7F20B